MKLAFPKHKFEYIYIEYQYFTQNIYIFFGKFFQKVKNGQKKCPKLLCGKYFKKNAKFVTEKKIMVRLPKKKFHICLHKFFYN